MKCYIHPWNNLIQKRAELLDYLIQRKSVNNNFASAQVAGRT